MFPTLSFGDQEFTPQEMSLLIAGVAGAMAAAGLKEGDTIALMLRNEPALIEVMLAARQVGLFFTPLNWHFKSEEAAYILRDCGAKALFVHADLHRQIADGIPPGVAVFALRPHPLTISAYGIAEPATRMPDGTSDWAALVAEAKPLTESAAIPLRGMTAYTSAPPVGRKASSGFLRRRSKPPALPSAWGRCFDGEWVLRPMRAA